MSDKSFHSTVRECWQTHQQIGWGGFVLKEKIKRLKARLKIWNKQQFGDTFKRYKKIEEDLNSLEVSTTNRQLND